MNREIEFRAWDGETMDVYEHSVAEPHRNETLGKWLTDNFDCDIMQYTGLKDKDGAKIYEGDIIESYHFTDRHGGTRYLYHVATWSDKYYGWLAVHANDYLNFEGDIIPGSPQLWVYMKDAKRIKVFGNIHENPELLTK